jgi:hypothetical protein
LRQIRVCSALEKKGLFLEAIALNICHLKALKILFLTNRFDELLLTIDEVHNMIQRFLPRKLLFEVAPLFEAIQAF